MLTVRYPNGIVVTYNSATYFESAPYGFNLYTSKGGQWICTIQLSAGVIVENVPACKVTDLSHADSLQFVLDHIQEFNSWQETNLLKKLKRELTKFNGRSKQWQ